MGRLTYDAGALIAAEAGDRRTWRRHRATLERGARPVVPAGVLGQVWRGGPQPELSRFLKSCEIEVLDEAGSRAAGTACGLAGSADVIDASVVVGAIRRGDAVVTGDPDDLRRLADALGAPLTLLAP
jgi:hypothetical protein